MHKRTMRVWTIAILGLAAASPARADLLNNWNVVTTGDLYAGYSTQGAVRVGGNLFVQNTFEAARAGSASALNPSLLVGGYLRVGNANPETVKVMKGDGVVGGTIHGAPNNNGRIVSSQNGGTIRIDPSIAKVAAADAQELRADSAAFLAMTGGAQSMSIPTRQVDTARFAVSSVDSAGNAVFNVDGAKLFENGLIRGFTLDLNGFSFGSGQSIVFNVSGNVLNFRNGLNFDGAFRTSAANILWNFYESTQINLGKNDFAGSLLAPGALLTSANRIDGSVFVGAFGTSYSNGMGADVRTMYVGYDPSKASGTMPSTSTPEPSAFAMAGIAAVLGLAFLGRRVRPKV